ncbi:hypothetical protein EYF80_042600 [Liparis tanakae]|uniref:Uncharacterized protein n=1 Tax=Liparis tanakae TaxID=230148 RepID=A0A4Z2G114_9TELE|nr:hypothetical protein EYF80_042600 [Liparis tanakae]
MKTSSGATEGGYLLCSLTAMSTTQMEERGGRPLSVTWKQQTLDRDLRERRERREERREKRGMKVERRTREKREERDEGREENQREERDEAPCRCSCVSGTCILSWWWGLTFFRSGAASDSRPPWSTWNRRSSLPLTMWMEKGGPFLSVSRSVTTSWRTPLPTGSPSCRRHGGLMMNMKHSSQFHPSSGYLSQRSKVTLQSVEVTLPPEAPVLVAGRDPVDDGLRPPAVLLRQGGDAQHRRPDRQGLRDAGGVLRAREDGLVVVHGDHFHHHGGHGVEVTGQATVGSLHLQLEGGRSLGGQRSLQPQDPRELLQGEVAAVARQQGVLHLRVYTWRRERCHRNVVDENQLIMF